MCRKRSSIVVLAALLTVGCAHGPKVFPAASAEADKRDLVFYALPKATPSFAIGIAKTSYRKGELTQQLKEWLATEESACTWRDRQNGESPCAWEFSLRKAETPKESLQCVLSEADSEAGVVWTAITMESLVVTPATAPDPAAQFAVQLSPGPLEKLKTSMTLDALGGLTGFEATATNVVAETVRGAVASALSASVAGDGDGGGVAAAAAKNDLEVLAGMLNELEKKKVGPTGQLVNAEALKVIEAAQLRLRSIAEGELVVAKEKLEARPDIARIVWPLQPSALSARVVADLQVGGKAKCVLAGGEARVHIVLAPSEDSAALVTSAYREPPADAGLRYSLPVMTRASALLLKQSGPVRTQAIDRAYSAGELQVVDSIVGDAASIPVPQWGPIMALPRSLGWGSGALSAKLDAATGALVFISSDVQGAPIGETLKDIYTRSQQDDALNSARAEKEALERQVSICASRRALRMPLGDCPATAGP